MEAQNLIMGKNCVQVVLDNFPERIATLFTSKKQDDPLIGQALKEGIKVKYLQKQQINELVQSESHQSYVALLKNRRHPELKSFLKEDNRLVLMLDSISDPQNVGALLRAAACFDVDAVVWSKNRGCPMTPVVAKASVGASELVPIILVSNLAEAVKQFQKAGYWAVTAEIDSEAESLDNFTFPDKTLLIVGSEGSGVQPLISKTADYKVFIPIKRGPIDSLNVSQATSVILSRIKH